MATSIAEADCVGFDIDHTLARYKNEALGSLIVRTFTTFLCETRGIYLLYSQCPLSLSNQPHITAQFKLPALSSYTLPATLESVCACVRICERVRARVRALVGERVSVRAWSDRVSD
jgi:hypothetical protein